MHFFLNQPPRVGDRHPLSGSTSRRCGFECLEPRQMLAADLSGGAADISFGHPGGPTGSISGSVFATATAANCDSHAASASLAEVRVQLLNETGVVIEERSTDATGAYHFADLLPGQYAVLQIAENLLLKGAAHVGDGGGIAIDANLVDEIVVQAGETLGGYDFCDFEAAVESAGPTDRPIVPHDGAAQVLPFLTLAPPATPLVQPATLAKQSIEPAIETLFAVLPPLKVLQPTAVYGGSSRSLPAPKGIETWDEDPFDSLFSTANFLDLARAELPTIDELMPILGEEDEGSDAPFADGYTSNSIDWLGHDGLGDDGLGDVARSELRQLMDDVEMIDVDIETADVAEPEVPKIARLRDVR